MRAEMPEVLHVIRLSHDHSSKESFLYKASERKISEVDQKEHPPFTPEGDKKTW